MIQKQQDVQKEKIELIIRHPVKQIYVTSILDLRIKKAAQFKFVKYLKSKNVAKTKTSFYLIKSLSTKNLKNRPKPYFLREEL